VLEAPPGAGKTTMVPLALRNEEWLAGRKIVMLEPRRLAARAAARRLAQLLDERVGQTVGYRMRMETRVGPATRIEVVTEGVLARMLQSDPALEDVGLLIFDEFHERSLHADLGLALALQSQELLREDLRIVAMSATFDGASVAALLGDAPVVRSEGRMFPVETRYLGAVRPEERLERRVAAAVRQAIADEEGDILVFLPGAGEIRRAEDALRDAGLPAGLEVLPLHGTLPQPAQDRAIAPPRNGIRRVVLSTSIAETSLTIEGIRIVIDAGLMRVPRFSARSGMTSLETIRVSRASADQRRGRAGRLGPGVCYRLWAEHDHLIERTSPEILEADLTSLALELAEWGIADPSALRWLDPPSAAFYSGACDLLRSLGALDSGGMITTHGKRMASLPLHPRLAHMVLRAVEIGEGRVGTEIAALLSERDLFRSDGGAIPDADLRLRLEALHSSGEGEFSRGHRIDRGTISRVLASARIWQRELRIPEGGGEIESAGVVLSFAYPDRIAQQRAGQPGRFLLRNGRAAVLAREQPLAESGYLVVAELDGRQSESRIFLAAPLRLEELEQYAVDEIDEEMSIVWDGEAGVVRARRRERLGALVLRESSISNPDPDRVAAVLLDAIRSEGLGILPWTRSSKGVQERMMFMRLSDAAWPDASDEALLSGLDEWLLPHLRGMRKREDLSRLDLTQILLGLLGWEERRLLDELAPTHIVVPSGSRIPIDYSTPASPVLAVRLQEMFGATDTPRINGGRVALTLHLLSPAGRPAQVTRDLASFWRGTYFDVRKDLKGRYPKHYWPDDPLVAEPTAGRRRRDGRDGGTGGQER
jgi:ATP-dependent helicase HrpB